MINTDNFRYITSPLAVAEWANKNKELTQKLAEAKRKLEDFDVSKETAMEKCWQWLKAHVEKTVGKDPAVFENSLTAIEFAFRNRTGTTSYVKTVQAQWVDMILPFCTVDMDALEKAFRARWPQLDIEKERKVLVAAVNKLENALAAQKAKADGLFTVAVEDAYDTVLLYISYWKSVATRYAVPVTPDKYAIYSMSDSSHWTAAYMLLGFDKITKTNSPETPLISRKAIPTLANSPLIGTK